MSKIAYLYALREFAKQLTCSKIIYMKHLLLFLISSLALNAHAQIALEHSYSGNWRMEAVNLDNGDYKYIGIDEASKKIEIYNSDHTLYKSVSTSIPSSATILYTQPSYASRSLFNTDGKIEMIVAYSSASGYSLSVYNEDGMSLVTVDNVFSYEVKKMGADWKLLVLKRDATPMYTDVYSLPGQFTGVLPPPTGEDAAESLIYPNPLETSATIEYKLPEGAHEGSISLYNAAGAQVRTYRVTDQFNNIIVDRGNLPAGQYLYNVTAAGQTSKAQKFVIR